MRKNAAPPEPAGESAPMWIVSYADLVTLTMSFFVVLYALKQGGEKQQMEVAAAIRSAFNSEIPPADSPSVFDQYVRRFKGLPGPPYENMGGKTTKVIKGAEGSNPEVQTIREGKQIVSGGRILFGAGQTSLSDADLETIKQIAARVKGHTNVLMIKGHVSADELTLRPDDPNGMSLSYARATAVEEALVKLGIDRRVLRPVACGPFEPIKTGAYDQAGLAQNRRSEVFTTDTTAAEYFPATTVPATTRRGGN